MSIKEIVMGAAGASASGGPVYIENVFSTDLYTGNGSTQAITNGIDLSTKGGLVWVKRRATVRNHLLFDTARGVGREIYSNTTDAQNGPYDTLTSFNTTGFSLGTEIDVNASGQTMASWTFREQAKFFDVVTYTGNGTNGRTVAHSLGSTPGCIIVKRTDAANGWAVYHRAMNASPQDYMMRLNATDGAFTTSPSRWNNTLPTSTEFTLIGNDEVNGSGATYVAYLFAHNAGGFGLTGTDNVISCGSYTGTGATGNNVTLGYEPQWLMIKAAERAQDWFMFDVMRGMTTTGGTEEYLLANSSGAAGSGAFGINPTATGFGVNTAGTSFNASGEKYIYIAIRRGPMKVPTSGTSVFSPNATSSASNPLTVTTNFPVDLSIFKYSSISNDNVVVDRLRGAAPTSDKYLVTNSTAAEATTSGISTQSNTALIDSGFLAGDTTPKIYWNFKRAPSFFDEVCYTGTGTAGQTYTHNLGVAPELMIIKSRSASGNWPVYSTATGNTNVIYLNYDTYASASNEWNNTTPTASVFTLGTNSSVNNPSTTYVAYLFATCPGVSKVGSYTGTGTTLQINCGFTSGARFVMIKRYDSGSTGDWYVWDSARGIVAGNDPYLLFNSTQTEITTTDYLSPQSSGFGLTSSATAALNTSGGTYLYLAIA